MDLAKESRSTQGPQEPRDSVLWWGESWARQAKLQHSRQANRGGVSEGAVTGPGEPGRGEGRRAQGFGQGEGKL